MPGTKNDIASPPKRSAAYDPSCFNVRSAPEAEHIILTPEIGHSTLHRWVTEAPHLLDLIGALPVTSATRLLDYGCGIGRLSAPLIAKTGCLAVGIDISASMRGLATATVASPRFVAMAPETAREVLESESFDIALAVWTLQHVFDPNDDIERIWNLLRPGGSLFVVNEKERRVPTDIGWVNDRRDIHHDIRQMFDGVYFGALDPEIVGHDLSARTFWAIYRKTR